MQPKDKKILLVLLGLFLISVIVTSLPPIRERITYRFDQIRTRVFYTFFPPEDAVFTPQQEAQVNAIVQATMQAAAPTPEPTITPRISPQPDVVAVQATPTEMPLPPMIALSGVRYEDQHGLWNYCAPATLSMGLSFWGWQGNRLDTGAFLKPFEKDKNVMLYEMVNYIQEETDLSVVLRSGGTPELLKKLVAGGFPVLIEKGTYIKEATTGKISWMGHYNLITGYDDQAGHYIVQDSYYQPDYPISYDLLLSEWRAFNNQFLVIYPAHQEEGVFKVLGDYVDPLLSNQIAAQKALDETKSLSDVDLFFAWFNRGSSLVLLQDYAGAAEAYDQAFGIYPGLSKDLRPYRITWYQTGPYFAYYYTGRYQDVIDLAGTTLDSALEPYLEESYYWRARAKLMLGDQDGAISDLRTSLEYHPNFQPSVEIMQQLGISN